MKNTEQDFTTDTDGALICVACDSRASQHVDEQPRI